MVPLHIGIYKNKKLKNNDNNNNSNNNNCTESIDVLGLVYMIITKYSGMTPKVFVVMALSTFLDMCLDVIQCFDVSIFFNRTFKKQNVLWCPSILRLLVRVFHSEFSVAFRIS